MSPHSIAEQIEGIHFMTDPKGQRIAVVINLEQYGDLLEEFFDVLVSRRSMAEGGRASLAEFRQMLEA